jgi:hypothetical protein
MPWLHKRLNLVEPLLFEKPRQLAASYTCRAKSAAPAHASLCDLPSVELPGDGVEACMADRLDVPNDRQDVGRKLRRLCLAGHAHALDGAGAIRRARPFSPSLCDRWSCLGPLGMSYAEEHSRTSTGYFNKSDKPARALFWVSPTGELEALFEKNPRASLILRK